MLTHDRQVIRLSAKDLVGAAEPEVAEFVNQLTQLPPPPSDQEVVKVLEDVHRRTRFPWQEDPEAQVQLLSRRKLPDAFVVSVVVQHETRLRKTFHEQYEKQETLPGSMSDVWEWILSAPDDYGFLGYEIPIPGTGRTERCATCKGRGIIACGNCNGTGFITCAACGGKGEWTCERCFGEKTMRCRGCSGSGRKLCAVCNGHGSVVEATGSVFCAACSGRGQTRCPECASLGMVECHLCDQNGLRRCHECATSGKDTCPVCVGKQTVICSKCNGKGAVWAYECLISAFEPTWTTEVVGGKEVPEPDLRRVREPVLLEAQAKRVKDVPSVNRPVDRTLMRMIRASLRVKKNRHVIKQKAVVVWVPVELVRYEREGWRLSGYMFSAAKWFHPLPPPVRQKVMRKLLPHRP